MAEERFLDMYRYKTNPDGTFNINYMKPEYQDNFIWDKIPKEEALPLFQELVESNSEFYSSIKDDVNLDLKVLVENIKSFVENKKSCINENDFQTLLYNNIENIIVFSGFMKKPEALNQFVEDISYEGNIYSYIFNVNSLTNVVEDLFINKERIPTPVSQDMGDIYNKIDDIISKIDNLTEMVDNKNTNNELQSKIELYENSIDELRKELSISEKSREDLSNQYENSLEKIKSLEEDYSKLLTENLLLKDEISFLKEEPIKEPSNPGYILDSENLSDESIYNALYSEITEDDEENIDLPDEEDYEGFDYEESEEEIFEEEMEEEPEVELDDYTNQIFDEYFK